jgi:hypothetical protein
LLALGLAALPSAAPAQYIAPTYYYPRPVPAYGVAYPCGYPGLPAGYQRVPATAASWGQPVYPYISLAAANGGARTLPPAQAVTNAQPATPAAEPPVRPPQDAPDKVLPPLTLTAGTTAPAAEQEEKPKDASPQPTPAAKDPAQQAPPVFPAPAGAHPPVAGAPPVPGPTCLDDAKDKDGGHPRFLAFADYLYWNVHNVDVPFAQPFNGIDPFNSVPQGPVAVASPRFTSGFRVGAGVAVGDDGWLVATYTDFRDTTGARIVAPDDLVLHSFLVFPNTVNSAGGSLAASAEYAIDLRTFDLDYRCPLVCGHNLLLEWLAGARYGHLDQHLLATFDISGTTTVDSHINFDGGGPRVGLHGDYKICGGLFGYGCGVLDVLFGRFHGSLEEQNVFTGLVGQTSVSEDRVVPILELELGAGWQTANGRLRLSAGYYVGFWFNALTTPNFISGVQGTNFTTNGNNFRDTITFDGLVGRVELRF